MKQFFKVGIIALFIAMISFGANAQEKKQSTIEEVTFVSSIDCKNCVKKVEANLPYEKGVKDMKIDLDKQTIYIKYDSKKTTKEKLAAAIVKLGYTAEEQTKETVETPVQ